MLDDPGKTPRLLVAVQGVALPFGVHLTPPLARLLREEQVALGPGDRQTVSEVSYLGDAGGIVCHIVPPDGGKAAIVSLTHVRVPPSMPAAAPAGAPRRAAVSPAARRGRDRRLRLGGARSPRRPARARAGGRWTGRASRARPR